VTFADISARPTSSHAALLDLALAAGSAAGVATAPEASITPLEHSVGRMGNPVYNANLPAPRPGDAEWSHDVPAALSLHREAECRDFVERMLESTLLLVMREALTSDITTEALGAAATASPTGVTAARGRAPRLSFVDELPVDLLDPDAAGGGSDGEEWSGVAGGADSVLGRMSQTEVVERLGRAVPAYHAADGGEDEEGWQGGGGGGGAAVRDCVV
jgi:hypothetical protein